MDRRKTKMKLERICYTSFAMFVLVVLLIGPATSQIQRREIISFSGVIESISKDPNFIVVNEAKIFISAATQIMDESGELHKIDYLRPKRHVTIEAFRNPNGLMARKIAIKTSKRER